ncbi:MAG: hypothetical protein ACRDJ4_13600 [Actinomycetota bacterium]
MPVLSGVRLQACAGRLALEATDLELTIRLQVRACTEQDGPVVTPAVVVPAKALTKAVASMTGADRRFARLVLGLQPRRSGAPPPALPGATSPGSGCRPSWPARLPQGQHFKLRLAQPLGEVDEVLAVVLRASQRFGPGRLDERPVRLAPPPDALGVGVLGARLRSGRGVPCQSRSPR